MSLCEAQPVECRPIYAACSVVAVRNHCAAVLLTCYKAFHRGSNSLCEQNQGNGFGRTLSAVESGKSYHGVVLLEDLHVMYELVLFLGHTLVVHAVEVPLLAEFVPCG